MAKGLGRGLGAILSDIEESYVKDIAKNSEIVQEIEVDKIIPNPYQPRKVFNNDSLKELASSIKRQGLLQPIIVTIDDGEYVLVAGERRLKATKLIKKDKIKAIIVDFDLTKVREFAIIENLQREDLNIIDLAQSIYELIEEHNYTHEEVAKILSKSRSYITNILRMLKLSDYAKEKLKENKITFGHAKSIASFDEETQKKLVDTIIRQKLSSREVEVLVKSYKKNSFKKDTENIDKKEKYDEIDLSNFVELIKEKYDLDIKNKGNNLIINVNSKKNFKKLKKIFDI
jgi:ParB family chromosome partitioning protein